MQARGVRGMSRARVPIYARPRHREPINAKPASKGGSAYPAEAGKLIDVAIESFP